MCEMCNFIHQQKTKKRQYIYYAKPNTETKLGIRNSIYMYTISPVKKKMPHFSKQVEFG